MTLSAPLILLVGLPGSGKSTWAKQFVTQRPGYCCVSTDEVRAHLYGDAAIQGEWMAIWRTVEQQLRDIYQAILQGDAAGAIYDATNVRRRHRREFVRAARACGYSPVDAIWIDTPLVTCLARNRARSRQVPETVIEKMHRQLAATPPAVTEGIDQVYRIGM